MGISNIFGKLRKSDPKSTVAPEAVFLRKTDSKTTAVPDAAVSDAAVSDAAVSDAAVSDAAVPDAAVSDAAVLDTAVFDTALPDAAVPDAAVPNTAAPDAAVPDAVVSDAAVPDAAVFDAAVSDAAVLDTAVFDTALPDAAVPNTAAPDAAVPDAVVPNVAVPDAMEISNMTDTMQEADSKSTAVPAPVAPNNSADQDDYKQVVDAISKSQAMIEFELDGTIITANENFLSVLGYSLDETTGKHHSMFVEPALAGSAEYKEFWAALGRGEYQAAEYKRIGKGGKEVWIQASYNPIFDRDGKPFKVVKFATDITEVSLRNANFSGQVDAISKAQAVIEFELDGTIITANENFLSVLGYNLDEITGKHHSMFVEPAFAAGAEYKEFWAALGRGEYQAAEYKRIGKGGKEVWIQASYNPIFDRDGKPFKVVKFATDITEDSLRKANFSGQVDAISKAQAVIEFELDGTILTANENFLSVLGYNLDEITGKHHSMFVEPAFAAGAEYKEFWAALGRGEYQAAEYKRIGKGGKEIWIQASYNPIFDRDGKPFKVVKFATDITEDSLRKANFSGQVDAISKAQAVIEFELDGTILTANENFLSVLGYNLDEITGKHHSMFVEPAFAAGAEYKEFWAALGRGEYQAAEYKRIGKGGKEIWIQASYNPIFDRDGKPFKVVKFATDITEDSLRNANFSGQVDAISKAQAVIEFELDGTILTANENFLSVLGYNLDEITGKHHSMFVEPAFAAGAEYKEFWAALGRGEYQAAEYKRIGKGGKEIWIQASYNPIFDRDGKPFKVVKFATDITEDSLRKANFSGQVDAISKAQAVIEFELDGTIINANENFLITLGYSLEEIQGQHHSMFVESAFAGSAEYKEFWAAFGRGEYQAAEYKRIGKGGKEVWIQASYNPINDLNGNPYKVVKYATDVTENSVQSADFAGQLEAIGKSQAVIEFELDGTIITANENFLVTLGYSLDEIQGEHHKMFVEPDYVKSAAYD